MKNKTEMDLPVKVNSLQDAKEKIYSDIQTGKNYRDIVKTKFDVNGTIKTFNIPQINKIKEEFEPKIEESRLDPDKAKVFKLFQKGYSPTDVIIKTELRYEFVKKSWNEYLEIENQVILPKYFVDELKKIHSKMLPRTKFSCPTFLKDFKESVEAFNKSLDWFFECKICGDIIDIDNELLMDVKKHLQKRWVHKKCTNKHK